MAKGETSADPIRSIETGTVQQPEDQRKLAHPDYKAMMRGRKDTNRARRRVRRSTQQGQRRH